MHLCDLVCNLNIITRSSILPYSGELWQGFYCGEFGKNQQLKPPNLDLYMCTYGAKNSDRRI